MMKMFHKTLFRSLNIINVVKGRFFSKEQQTSYLFNLCTSFEIYVWIETKKKLGLQPKLHQPLFSKAFYMCIGPDIDDVDTFFAIRDTDIIHFQYSSTDNLFRSINCIQLPPACITPNFAFYQDGQLIISCFHGGICGYIINKSSAELSFAYKTCNSVLQCFPAYKDCFFRIETGSNLVVYRINPFRLDYKRSYDTQKRENRIFYCFPFGQDAIIFSTKCEMKYVSTNSDTEIMFPPPLQYDPIIDHSPIAPSDVLILTRSGYILRLRSDLSLTVIRREKTDKFLRIFNLDGNHILLVNKSSDHIIINQEANQVFSLNSTIGLSDILISNPKLSKTYEYAPTAYSFVGNELISFRQGISLKLLNEFELPEKPIGLFDFRHNGKEFIILSFKNGSKLLEIVKDQKQSCIKDSQEKIYQDSQTIGVLTFQQEDRPPNTFQILPNGVANFPFMKLNPSKKDDTFIMCAHTSRINSRISDKNVLCFSGYVRKVGSSETYFVANERFELPFKVTYYAFSPPDETGISEFFVFGIKTKNEPPQYGIIFQTISEDESEREIVIHEKMPEEVVSFEFIHETSEKPLGMLIGLNDGGLIVGEVNFKKREIETKQIIQLGIAPCRIRAFRNFDNPLFFGLSTRLWLLDVSRGKNQVRAHPFWVSSPSFMAMDSDYRILLIRDSIFSVYSLSQRSRTNTDYNLYRKSFPNNIISLYFIDKITNNNNKMRLPLLLIVCKQSIFLADTTFFDICNKLVNFDENTFVTNSSYSNRQAFSLATGEALQEVTFYSYLAVSTCAKRTYQDREEYDEYINVYRVVPSYLQFLVTHNEPVETIKKNLGSVTSLLDHIITSRVTYHIDAISVTNCPISLYAKAGKFEPTIVVGSRSTVYVYIISNKKLNLVTKIGNIGVKINHIYSSLENHLKAFSHPKVAIYVSDEQQSIRFLSFDTLTTSIEVVSEEGIIRPISTSLVPYMIKKSAFCGGDKLGNFFIFTNTVNQQMREQRKQIQKLVFWYSINVGDIITGVDMGCDYKPNLPRPIWYSTIGGNVGCFLEFPASKKSSYPLMHMLEIEISQLFFQLTNCDSLAFRNKYYQSHQVCDLDVAELFQSLAPERKNYIIDQLRERNLKELLGIPQRETGNMGLGIQFGHNQNNINNNNNNNNIDLTNDQIIDIIESEILKCTNYFLLWNQS